MDPYSSYGTGLGGYGGGMGPGMGQGPAQQQGPVRENQVTSALTFLQHPKVNVWSFLDMFVEDQIKMHLEL